MALVDASYKVIWVEANGACSDAQIFNNSKLKEKIEDGTLDIPQPENLLGDDRPMPYFLIGDEAFALRTTMMKPYSSYNMDHDQRVYNYRCSRARRVVENAFSVLASGQLLPMPPHHPPPAATHDREDCAGLHLPPQPHEDQLP